MRPLPAMIDRRASYVTLRNAAFGVLGCGVISAIPLSANPSLWAFAACSLAGVLVVLPLHGVNVPIIWCIFLGWVSIVTDLLNADLIGEVLTSYRMSAVVFSCTALVVTAIGAAIAVGRSTLPVARSVDLEPARLGLAYIAAAAVSAVAAAVAALVPALQQPLLTVSLLKFTVIYLLSNAVFGKRSGYPYLVLVLSWEVVSGMTGFFGTYKEAFYIVLIALAATGGGMRLRSILVAVLTAALVIFLSLTWTALKPDYRYWVGGYTGQQIVTRSFSERVAWITDRVLNRQIDYEAASSQLLARIGYTGLYAEVLARVDAGLVPENMNRFRQALVRVLMPRVIFPDKEIMDDSAVTIALTGRSIDETTSISVGYVAEAHVDFGVPFMFFPLLTIGVAIGLVARYFATRNVGWNIREAFSAPVLFQAFPYGANIDKAVGGFLMSFALMVLLLVFLYPVICPWLIGKSLERKNC